MVTNTLINKQRPVEILLVEDNKGDAILTARAFKKGKLPHNLTTVNSGEGAVAFLKKEGAYAQVITPDIILLDLNLPKMNGQDVLSVIKSDETLMRIPVIILSSSRAEEDVARSYKLHANAYIIKPLNSDEFHDVVEKLEQFWFTLVVLPDPKDV